MSWLAPAVFLEVNGVPVTHVGSEPERSVALLRSTYGHVPAGTPLWGEERTFL